MLDKLKIQKISTVKHPESSELERTEGQIKLISSILTIGWDLLFFLIACFSSSMVGERAQYSGMYTSDYRFFIYNIFGAEIPVDPAEDFFASPFMIFMFIIAIGFLGSCAITIISHSLITGIRAKRLTLDETFRTCVLTKYMAEEKITEEAKQTDSTENQ